MLKLFKCEVRCSPTVKDEFDAGLRNAFGIVPHWSWKEEDGAMWYAQFLYVGDNIFHDTTTISSMISSLSADIGCNVNHIENFFLNPVEINYGLNYTSLSFHEEDPIEHAQFSCTHTFSTNPTLNDFTQRFQKYSSENLNEEIENVTIYSQHNADGTTTITIDTWTLLTNGEKNSTTIHEYDANGNYLSSSTTSEITYTDGSIGEEEITYNENGTIASESLNIEHPDGSTESHTVNHDENGNPTDGENQWIDTSGNENTQTVEYNEDGDPYITGYAIDTTNNPNGGENLVQPIDTGVLAFDGRDFDIHLKCKFYWSNIQYASGSTATRINPIMNFSANDANNRVNGFLIAFLSRGSGNSTNKWWNFSGTQSTTKLATIMRVTKYVNDSAGQVYHIQKSPGTGDNKASGIGAAQNATGSDTCIMDITCRSNVFHIGVTNGTQTLQTVCQSFNQAPYTNQDLDFGSTLFNNITVELGHWDSVVDNVQYSFNYEVLEFDIHKL